MSGMPSFVNAVTFSADGAFVATAGFEGGARVWDAATGELLAAIDAHRSSINSIQLTPDGRFMLTAASYDARVKVWRVDLVATPPDRDAVTQLLDCRHRDCGAMPAFDSKR
jgi:WD40 repeat protein